jgi:hypothetical protein
MHVLIQARHLASYRGIHMAVSSTASCVLSLLNVPSRAQAVKHTKGHLNMAHLLCLSSII